MHARLVFLSGSKVGTAFELGEADTTIGRKPDSTIAFSPDDILVSTEHATLSYRNGRYVVRDAGSRNGTFVNSERVTEKELEHGDVIQFGLSGPSARYVLETGVGVVPTLDIVSATHRSGTELDASGRMVTPAGLTTRELVVMSYGRLATQMQRRTYAAVWVVAGLVIAIAVLAILQQRSQSRFERGLADLAAAVTVSGGAMEQDLAGLQARYALLRDAVAQGEQATSTLLSAEGVSNYTRAVVLIAYSYGYAERTGGRLLRYEVDSQGQILTTSDGEGPPRPSVSFDASGPPVQSEGIATGFLVDSTGYVVTNRWVTEPWEVGPELSVLRERGLDLKPRLVEIKAYLPPGNQLFPLSVHEVSNAADVAVMRLIGEPPAGTPVIPLAPDTAAVRAGDPLLFIGYPADARNLLFRMDSLGREDLLRRMGGDSRKLLEELSRRGLIMPIITQGKVQAVTDTEITNTAGAEVGGSGAPLVDGARRVVAVQGGLPVRSGGTAAVKPGVPIRNVWSILPSHIKRKLERPIVSVAPQP